MLALFAVHISDTVVSDPVAFGAFVPAAFLIGIAIWRITEEEIPRVGVLTAAFFVASQIHLPLGGTSAHLLLNGLLGVILGRRAPLAIAVGLFLQMFLFSHGGMIALGLNITIYALPALLAGLTFRPVRRLRLLPDGVLGFLFGLLTGLLTVLLNAAVLMYAGKEEWDTLVKLVLLANLPVVLVEAVTVGFVVQYLARVKPEWLA